jgi:hypothetical protein
MNTFNKHSKTENLIAVQGPAKAPTGDTETALNLPAASYSYRYALLKKTP